MPKLSLPFLKKKSRPEQNREYFFGLEIDHSVVKSSVWSVINDRPQVLSVGNPAKWDDSSLESLVQAADASLSDSGTRLDPSGKIQPDKVILGLPPDWITDDKIHPDKIQLLKALSQKLSLKAVGFVVTPESVVRFIQQGEGVPPTAILLGFWQDYLEITVVRLGKIDGIYLVKRSPNPVADVIEGLTRFPQMDMLPSRMLLYDSAMNLEDIRQQLLAHPWQAPQTRLPFLHFPKIEILPADFTIRAISLAGGSEVARAVGLITDTPVSAPPEQSRDMDTENLGFVTGRDISQETAVAHAAPIPVKAVGTRPKLRLPAVRLPHFSLPRISLPSFPLLIPLIIILLAAGLFAAYWYLPKVQVELTVTPRALDHQFNLTADTAITSPDSNRPALPAKYLEVSVNGSKSQKTTGSKLVGDKATGSVTIINGTASPHTFNAGTVLSSPSGLKFTLDSGVSVASASGTADPNSYQPGKTTASVTASVIGTDSNLSAGTQFRVDTFASLDFVAKNDAAFSGGSSRQVQAVSKDDQTALRTAVSSDLKDQAKTTLLNQVSGDQSIITESIQLQTVTEEFDRKEGDTADNLTLKLSVKATGISFTKSDLDQLIQTQLKPLIPADYKPVGDVTKSFTVQKTDKTTATLAVHLRASLLPSFKTDEIKNQLLGKAPKPGTDYLSSLPGVTKVQLSFTYHLPAPLLTFPRQAKNIDLVITPGQ